MIEYKLNIGKRGPIKVKLDGRIVGEIREVDGDQGGFFVKGTGPKGYQYFPKGSKNGGEIFKTVALVQKSLQQD